jgi:hypothetical protein
MKHRIWPVCFIKTQLMFSVKSMCCKEEIWQRITKKIREKPACAKIRENASPHFQSQRPTVLCCIYCIYVFHSLGTVHKNNYIISYKINYGTFLAITFSKSQKSEVARKVFFPVLEDCQCCSS